MNPSCTPFDEHRDAWLDWCRSFAIFAVVLTHVVEKFYPLYPFEAHTAFAWPQRVVAMMLFTFGRLGVPIFLFLTGYLLPERYAATSAKSYLMFFKKKWLPLFFSIELWYLIYIILMSALGKCQFSFRYLLSCLTFSSHPPLSHVWYMEMILGLYLVIPFLGVFGTIYKKNGVVILFATSLFCHLIRPMFQICWIDLSFLGDYYLTYMIYGYCVCLYRDCFQKLAENKMVYFLVVAMFVANVGICIFRQMQSTPMRLMWYDNLSLMSAALFPPIILLPLKTWNNSVTRYISIQAFGIYLIHNLVLDLGRGWFMTIDSRGWRMTCAWIMSIIISVLIPFTFRKAPHLRHLLFLTK